MNKTFMKLNDAYLNLAMQMNIATQGEKEFMAEYNSVKSHFHPIVWFFIKWLYV